MIGERVDIASDWIYRPSSISFNNRSVGPNNKNKSEKQLSVMIFY